MPNEQKWYIHKHSVSLEYGGPEEGGWHYNAGVPDNEWSPPSYDNEEQAYEVCRDLNRIEGERRKGEEDYAYHSVLAYKSQHYSYSVSESPVQVAYPTERPFYE